MYFVILLIGGVGYVVMVLSGSLHGLGHGAHSGPGSHAPVGHGTAATHGLAGHGGHAPVVHTEHHVAQQAGSTHHSTSHHGRGSLASSRLLSTLSAFSPLSIFTTMVGFGAVGMLLQTWLVGQSLFFAALAGGLAFNFLLVRPLMGLMMRFASNPIEGLEGAVAREAEATNNFDASGKGVVRLTLDGESVRLLATLNESEMKSGIRIQRGDKLLVLDVDPHKNSCRVTKELASSEL